MVRVYKKGGDPAAACFHANVEIRISAGQAEHESDDPVIRNRDKATTGIEVGIKDDFPTKGVECDIVTWETKVPQRDYIMLVLGFVLPDCG
jgi:hypothetical protein